MNRCNEINYIELRNVEYYWIIIIFYVSYIEEIIMFYILYMNIFGGILFIIWLEKIYINC